ncbi:hypothetical protein FNH22_27890 [Fulvivirga sp. M361]|uniref:hypothetical protein n=1 Tax=Fulvivirga sp. M361 TaxID=2594266 RepID=UPI00117B129D|nr:hypothetical protein [Fulvivirga sp. M361]TRX49058.1 hypothetical protein FNH22_27890 [Fulvivirga sp. M361]
MSHSESSSLNVLDVEALIEGQGSFDDEIAYSISGKDVGDFTINPATGVLTFFTIPDFENPTDYQCRSTSGRKHYCYWFAK